MSRRNQGAKLRYLEDRGAFYITWTVDGRSRKFSTGTASSEDAQNIFTEWLQARKRAVGPSDPAQALVTDILADYITERGPKVVGQETMARAVRNARPVMGRAAPLQRFRHRAAGTVRRELSVLQAAINHAHKHGKLTRTVVVELPPAPPPKERWLTRDEAAKLIQSIAQGSEGATYMLLFILIGIYTGRRKEAILSLRWPQIDLKANRIDFEIEGRERTKKRRGKVPIPKPPSDTAPEDARVGAALVAPSPAH